MEKYEIDLAVESVKQQLVEVINNSGVSPYLLKYVLKDLYNECAEISTKMLSQKIEELKSQEQTKSEEVLQSELVEE